jgi:hypothetical protein
MKDNVIKCNDRNPRHGVQADIVIDEYRGGIYERVRATKLRVSWGI